MQKTVQPITAEERARRQAAVNEAAASLRLEGLASDVEAKAIWQRYIEGELTIAEAGAEVDKLNERDFGPLPVPRNGRSKEHSRHP
jgi:hypothetical protein